jgi:hypothetical protein
MKRYLWLFLLALISCTNDSPNDLIGGPNQLVLKWNKAYADDTLEKSSIGLQWAFSYLGARLSNPSSGMRLSAETITIIPEELGFDDAALSKLAILHEKIKASEEYRKTKSIDLGRYVTLILGASEHYYAITGVPEQLSTLLSNYQLLPQKGYVNKSGVALEHRIIAFSAQKNLNQVFLSSEIDSVSGSVYEYETVEILPNGQLRFGIFDNNGNRKNNADASHSNAGKPAKCMWCHESTIQRLFYPQLDFPDYLTYAEFKDSLFNFNQDLTETKLAMQGGVDYAETQQHTLTELLYISFMEPSAARLAEEWNMTLAEVAQLLSGLPTHTYAEFPFLGDLYSREEVEDLAPFKGLEVSSKVREQSAIEVNHLE